MRKTKDIFQIQSTRAFPPFDASRWHSLHHRRRELRREEDHGLPVILQPAQSNFEARRPQPLIHERQFNIISIANNSFTYRSHTSTTTELPVAIL